MIVLVAAVLLSAAEPGAADLIELTTPADVERVCDALRPAERVPRSGSPLDRADALVRHDAAREEAASRRYRVVVPAEQLRFAGYDPEEQLLSLFGHAPLAGAGGALRLQPVTAAGLPAEAERSTVERILAAQQERALTLAIVFAVPEDEATPCFRVPGTGSSTLAVTPLAWEYRVKDTVVARGGEAAHRPLVSAKEGATPRVRLGSIAEGAPVRAALEGRFADLEGCYRTARERDPWIDGAIVADLAPGAQGPRIAADTLQDEAMVGCVRTVLARVSPEGRAFVPIHFELAAPAK
jgi:hypothetical protein